MDNYDNFFDDQRNLNNNRTPIYHTPEPKRNDKHNVASVVCIVMAVVMCIAVIANVIVLATIKTAVAEEYAKEMSAILREEYANSISDILNNNDIVEDIIGSATNKVNNALDSSIGKIADSQCSASVARLYMSTSSQSNAPYEGIASGFLISDTNDAGTLQRYLVTNAHCVRYARSSTSGSLWGGGILKYEWDSYKRIVCNFDNDDTYYDLEIIAYGAYDDENLSAEYDQPDLAVLRIKGTKQPSNEAHPSLKIAGPTYTVNRGSEVALIGNPEGMGKTNSISTGCISQTGIRITSWGEGEFIMTDAAVNGGNSGGPMVDIQGVVVGVVESKLVSEEIDNMGFALSADTLLKFLDWASKPANNKLLRDLSFDYKLAV